jgi:hypothetical protein
MRFLRIGDLVRYCLGVGGLVNIGIIIGVDHRGDGSVDASLAPYKVRWTHHYGSSRDWYREDELEKL